MRTWPSRKKWKSIVGIQSGLSATILLSSQRLQIVNNFLLRNVHSSPDSLKRRRRVDDALVFNHMESSVVPVYANPYHVHYNKRNMNVLFHSGKILYEAIQTPFIQNHACSSPMKNHTKRRTQFALGSDIMSMKQIAAPLIGR